MPDSSSNPLDPAWQAYLVIKDALKIARRATRRGGTSFFRGTTLSATDQGAAQLRLDEGQSRADELVIVAMWAEFERYVIAYLGTCIRAIERRSPRPLSQALAAHLEERLERSQIDDLLDLLKSVVDPQKVGQAKKIKKFRDWIAHRNPRKATPEKADPRTTYALLAGIVEVLNKASKRPRSSLG